MYSCEPQRRHFAEYLTGSMVASRCRNRVLTEVPWDVRALNECHLQLLQRNPATRYHDQRVIALGSVLTNHDGKFIEDIDRVWDQNKSTK